MPRKRTATRAYRTWHLLHPWHNRTTIGLQQHSLCSRRLESLPTFRVEAYVSSTQGGEGYTHTMLFSSGTIQCEHSGVPPPTVPSLHDAGLFKVPCASVRPCDYPVQRAHDTPLFHLHLAHRGTRLSAQLQRHSHIVWSDRTVSCPCCL